MFRCFLLFVFGMPHILFSQGLLNGSGSSIVANGDVYIVIQNGGVRNDGDFSKGSSYFVFSGNSATTVSVISGTTNTSFNNLILNKSVNGLQLNTDISVSGNVSFQSGDSIFLNNHILDLGTTGSIIGENETKRFTGLNGGYITLSRAMSSPVNSNPGNIGISITSSADLGTTVIKRYHTIQKGRSVSRVFEILPTNNAALDATFAFNYQHAELNGNAESGLMTYSSNDGNNWQLVSNTALNTTTNLLTSIGVSSFRFYTLFQSGILPLRFISFSGKIVDRRTMLNWNVEEETDNHHFEVERSADGVHFSKIGFVLASLDQSRSHAYSFSDQQVSNGLNYYRLRQVDNNGRFTYSDVVRIYNLSNERVWLSPNPATALLNVNLNAGIPGNINVQILDLSGRTCYQSGLIRLKEGTNTITVNISGLTNGVYLIRTSGLLNESIQFFKK